MVKTGPPSTPYIPEVRPVTQLPLMGQTFFNRSSLFKKRIIVIGLPVRKLFDKNFSQDKRNTLWYCTGVRGWIKQNESSFSNNEMYKLVNPWNRCTNEYGKYF